MTKAKVWYYQYGDMKEAAQLVFDSPVDMTVARGQIEDTNLDGTSRLGLEVWCSPKD